MTYPVLTKEQLAPIIAYHKALTQASFTEASSSLSEKAAKCQALITSNAFGCNTVAVANLVSIILGEELSSRAQAEILSGSVIVSLAGDSAGTIALVGAQGRDGSVRGYTSGGSRQQQSFSIHSKNLRRADEGEIERFFEERHGLRSDASATEEHPF